MTDSILTSIKKLLGIDEEYEHFDIDLILHINSVLSVLTQLGVGDENFFITGKNEKWSDYISDDARFNLVKAYVYLKVRLLFDPPSSSAIIESINRLISEIEWRINILS
jgi:hypothetical protein